MTRFRPSRLLALTTGALLAASAALGTALPAVAAVTPVTATYDYTGGPQTFQVPAGVTAVSVTAAGGQGAPSPYDDNVGGRGASVSATLGVTGGSTLTVVVAGDGRIYCPENSNCGGYGAGSGGNGYYGGGGGGGSAVRDAGGTDLLVAAGGGGAGAGEDCTEFVRAGGGSGGDAGAAGVQGGACTLEGSDLYGGQGGSPGGATSGGAGGAGGGGRACDGSVASPGVGGASATGPDGASGNYSGAGGGGHFGGGAGGERAITSCGRLRPKSGSGGGGGGSSYVTSAATGSTVGLSDRAYGSNGQVTITYTPVVSGITLTPTSSSVAAGGGQAYSVTATTTSGGSADVTDESTLSIAPSAGGSATGASCTGSTCTAQTAGVYTVTATRGSQTSTASLTVTAGAASSVTATSGYGQSATAGTAFANPLVATVTDAYGNPVSGATVTFAVDPSSAGTATVSNGGQATTGSNGQASVTLTAGSTAGLLTVTATSGTGSAGFPETVTPAGPARADLAATLAGPTSVRSGSSAALSVTVKNNGPSASGRYLAAVILPRQLTPTAYSGGTRYGSVVVFRGATLASGASVTYQVPVTARGKGTVGYAGTAMATTADPKPANNVTFRSTTIT